LGGGGPRQTGVGIKSHKGTIERMLSDNIKETKKEEDIENRGGESGRRHRGSKGQKGKLINEIEQARGAEAQSVSEFRTGPKEPGWSQKK